MKKNSFITVRDRQFLFNQKPYYIIGANLWYGGYLGAEKKGRGRLLKELDLLQSIGINNLRVIGASEDSNLKGAIKPGIQTSPGVYNETLLKGLDYLLAEMKKRDMSAVVFLNNYWDWTGGMAQYVAWQNPDSIVHLDKVPSYRDFMKYAASFYENQSAQIIHQEYIFDLLHRKNTFTGLLYKNDPTIMAWELANEPRPHPDAKLQPEKLDYFYQWINACAAYIKSEDSNHLVTTGSEGTKGCLEIDDCFIKSHISKDIDYICIHLWPRNWGWWKPDRMEESLVYSEQEAVKYIDQQLQLTDHLHKPMVLEEFGMDRDHGSNDPKTPVTARNHFYQTVYNKVHQIASSGGRLAGTNLWAWGGFGRSPRPDFIWQEGDPYPGDPKMEPQGRNSVFNTDTETLNIIQQNANQLKSLMH